MQEDQIWVEELEKLEREEGIEDGCYFESYWDSKEGFEEAQFITNLKLYDNLLEEGFFDKR